MVEGFLVFYSLFEVVGIQEHGEICEVVVRVGGVLDGFKMDCIPSLCPNPNVFSTERF